MLFHVDMIYLAKQAKCDVEESFEMRTVTKSNPERDFISFMSKRRKYTNTHGMYITALIRPSYVNKSNRSYSMKE